MNIYTYYIWSELIIWVVIKTLIKELVFPGFLVLLECN